MPDSIFRICRAIPRTDADHDGVHERQRAMAAQFADQAIFEGFYA
jgi:hypothetical protein